MVEWCLPEERKRLTKKQWTELFMKQNGRCPNCDQRLEAKGSNEVDIIDEHLKPLSMGGGNELSNRQLWCKPCSSTKTIGEAPVRAKSNRTRAKHIGAPAKKSSWRSKPDGYKFCWKTGRYERDDAS